MEAPIFACMMTLHFGTDFDGIVAAPPQAAQVYFGPQKLLSWLEHRLGLGGYPENTDYLRIELYRQALNAVLEAGDSESIFYEKSFQADRFATAAALLEWRDELVLAGWDFAASPDLPARLRTFSSVEALFKVKCADPANRVKARGWADRFQEVLTQISGQDLPFEQVFLYEPFSLQTPVIQRFLDILQLKGVGVSEKASEPAAPAHSALGYFQRAILGQTQAPFEGTSEQDGSILILKAHRDSDAALVLAQLLRQNPTLQPLLLASELDLSLEQALVQEGLPAMGVLSASSARPSLQVLKLAPAFLWEPVDIIKIMEFVTLPVKPFDDALALEIARVLAEKPGLFSDTWFAAVYGYLDKAEDADTARAQYNFWFERRRYRTETTAPKREAMALYQYLQDWAFDFFEQNGRKNMSLLTLAEQARRIHELLDALPEQRIGFLELERIVRTIYDPSPVQMLEPAVDSYPYVQKPGAIAAPYNALIWWNCLFENTAPKPDKWQLSERNWLKKNGVALFSPDQQGRLNLLRQQRPILQTGQQLILVVPAQRNGAAAIPSLILGDLEAQFKHHKSFTFSLDEAQDRAKLSQILQTPGLIQLPQRISGRPQPQLHFNQALALKATQYETPTNLESFFYYPHRWFFRQKLRFYPINLLSVNAGPTLLGNLAHRFFEFLLAEGNLDQLDKRGVQQWVDEKAPALLEKEGATLLLYGREPERNAFLNRVKNAAWSLISLLRNNGWSVLHTEHRLEGQFMGIPVHGKADLVLQRGEERAIVDLKWSGAKRRKELIQNGEDLQLVLYAHLLAPAGAWPHTAYFILEDGKMIARNRAAFTDAVVAGKGDEDHAAACAQTLEKMQKTYAWRQAQIQAGVVELRTARTAQELESLYEGQLMELLEMKNEDARWDDYRTLLEFM